MPAPPRPEQPARDLVPHEQAVWDHLAGLARTLDPAADIGDLVDALPGYVELARAADPDGAYFVGSHARGIGDALRAVHAQRPGGRPALAGRAGAAGRRAHARRRLVGPGRLRAADRPGAHRVLARRGP